MRYAIFGATGAVGKALTPALAEANEQFRVAGRSGERLRRDFGGYEPLVAFCAANLRDPRVAASVAAGVETVFYLVGVPYPQFDQHPKLSRFALDAAGVRLPPSLPNPL